MILRCRSRASRRCPQLFHHQSLAFSTIYPWITNTSKFITICSSARVRFSSKVDNINTVKSIHQVFSRSKDHDQTAVYDCASCLLKKQLQQSNDPSRAFTSNWFNPKPLVTRVISQFLPQHFPHSVSNGREYIMYSMGNFTNIFLGTINGVMSMQSMLYAVGLNNSMAIPLSGALNWLLKDGLGQLGGVLYAGLVNVRFDANPKFWRFTSTVLMETACLMELLLPIIVLNAANGGGFYFVAVASAANVLKNISFLTTSAARASIHKSFAVHENLADITAKSGSQAILASMLGTSAGIFVVSLVGDNMTAKLAVFAACSLGNLVAMYSSLARVTTKSLTADRLEYMLCHVYQGKLQQPGVLDVEVPLLSPQDMRQQEKLLLSPTYTGPQGKATLSKLLVGSALSESFHTYADYESANELFANRGYLLSVASSGAVHLLFKIDAQRCDVLSGFIHACIVRCVNPDQAGAWLQWDTQERCHQLARRIEKEQQWIVEEMLLETNYARIAVKH